MAAKQFPFATAPALMGGAGGQWAINQAIPGLAGLTAGATGIINNALTGIPSPSESRLENAYFGAGSGLDPSSDFLRNRGYDLYKRKAQAQQRGGIQDLMSMIGAYSGNVAPTPGEQIGQQESTANRLQQGSQFQTQIDFEKQKYQDELKLLAELIGPLAGTTAGGAVAPGATTAPQTTGAPGGTGAANSIINSAVHPGLVYDSFDEYGGAWDSKYPYASTGFESQQPGYVPGPNGGPNANELKLREANDKATAEWQKAQNAKYKAEWKGVGAYNALPSTTASEKAKKFHWRQWAVNEGVLPPSSPMP